MAEILSRISSKCSTIHLNPSSVYLKVFIFAFCLLTINIPMVQTAACPNSVPSSALKTKEQSSFSGSTSTYVFGVIGDPVSNSLYYLYGITITIVKTVLQKVDASGSQIWLASFVFQSCLKSLSLDETKQNVYLASSTSSLAVLKLSTSNGAIVSQQLFSIINGVNDDIKICPLADYSGYYVNGYDSLNTPIICRYIFLSSNAQCQSVTNIKYGFGLLMISQTQLFILGASPTFPYAFHMYKLTFLSTSVDWANTMACSSGTCTAYYSGSIFSADGLQIYLFFPYGATRFLYFVSVSTTNGSVLNTRYKSSASILSTVSIALNEDYIVVANQIPNSVMIYSISTSVFTIKLFSGTLILSGGVEPSSGRFIINGQMGTNGYTTKFIPQSIGSNSDFTTTVLSMNVLPVGTDVITPESGVTIGVASSIAITAATYSNLSATYTPAPSTSSDVYFYTKAQSFSFSEATNNTCIPNLSCSFSGTTSIFYSLSNYNGSNIPFFVSINSATGVLSINAPNVSSSTDYVFMIVSTISGMSSQVNDIITLTIMKCTVSNCRQCSATDSSVCSICELGYNLNSGICNLPESETAKSLTTSNQAIIGSTIVLCIALSLFNPPSLAYLWSMINQTQIFFLLFLTGAFIPKDIEDIITGLKICLNPFSYFQSNSGGSSNFVSNIFNFGLGNTNLKRLGIESDSIAVNVYSFILSILIICFLHLCIAFYKNFLIKENKSNCCNYILRAVHWILNKLMTFCTFALYIRIILKINQYVLICSISEIYHFDHSDAKRIVSLVIALIFLFFCITMIIIVIIFFIIKYKDSNQDSQDKSNKFAHLFNGISPSKKARLYVAALLLRRIIFVTLLITIEPVSSVLVISICLGFQVIYFAFVIFIKPYKLVKCDIIEIINETYFLIMLASLLKYNSISNWERTPTAVYTCLISSNSIIGFIIIFKVQPATASRASYAQDELEPSSNSN